ncbi:MAG: TolC family protein [Verrucomicrobia bacterium]|nr:TolC family protein [Verrucomicrobiota bacterium]
MNQPSSPPEPSAVRLRSDPHRGRLPGVAWLGAITLLACALECGAASRFVTLRECLVTALLANRDLQVERLNPEIAQANLSLAAGAYDPLFVTELRKENSSDSGGFDPSDFSRDAIYDAESDVIRAGLVGLLPSGLTYTLDAGYANSYGTRNFLNFDSYKVSAGFLLRQPLLKNLWIDDARFSIRVSRRDLAISELGLRFITMDVINRVQLAYFELAQTHRQLAVQESLVETRRQLLHGIQRQLEQGLAALPDQQLAMAQLAMAEATAAGARTAVRLAENDLRTHLGDSFTNQLQFNLVPLDPLLLTSSCSDLAGSWRNGLAHRPDLLQFREEIAKANLNLSYRRNQLFPALDLVGGYGRKGASVAQMPPPLSANASPDEAFDQLRDGTAPSDMIGIAFSVPLSLASERANYRLGKHYRAQAELRLKQKEELVLREISDAFHTVQTSLERAQAAAHGVDHARAAAQAEERRLAGGKSTLFLVLELQDQLVNLQAAAIRATADYNRAVSQLAFADGSSLEKNAIQVESHP